jgi:hypothetical protein
VVFRRQLALHARTHTVSSALSFDPIIALSVEWTPNGLQQEFTKATNMAEEACTQGDSRDDAWVPLVTLVLRTKMLASHPLLDRPHRNSASHLKVA